MSSPRYLVAADKFKGTLSAETVCARISDAIRQIQSTASVILLPIADGGDGTAEIVARQIGAEQLRLPTVDALGRPIIADCYVLDSNAYLDCSSASGLARLQPEELQPLHSNTLGTGQLMRELFVRGCRTLYLGLGGSATVDAGFGMAAALGFKFLDADGAPILPMPANFSSIRRLEPPPEASWGRVIALSDVETTLFEPSGAMSVFGPQKGLTTAEISSLDELYVRLLPMLGGEPWVQLAKEPRSGAAGGLGFGVRAFLGGELVSGFSSVAEQLGLARQIEAADIVITGEGCLDAQSLAGKGPGCVAELAHRVGTPVWAVAGIVRDREFVAPHFDRIIEVAAFGSTHEQSMREPERALVSAVLRSLRGA